MSQTEVYLRKIKSFVRRDSRMTTAQRLAFTKLMPQVGLSIEAGQVDFAAAFGNTAPCIVEIGFGSGQSLLEVAQAQPEKNFIGIETYQPGIGALLLGMDTHNISNIRVFYGDAVDVLQKCIKDASLELVQIFFPDPWRKRKHHKRRLIQPEFVRLIANKLQLGGLLHLATDWEHYAMHMMDVLSAEPAFSNQFGVGEFATRSSQRPTITKFEQRGHESGRAIWELQFEKSRVSLP